MSGRSTSEPRSPGLSEQQSAVQASDVGNDNAGPFVELRHTGDGRAFVRALARSIVRAELIAAGVIAAPEIRRAG